MPVSFSVDLLLFRAVDSGGAGGGRAPPEFEGSEKGRSLISAYRSLAITTNNPGFKKISTALSVQIFLFRDLFKYLTLFTLTCLDGENRN